MSARSESESRVPEPRATSVLFGHGAAETALLDAYRSGRIPHAWLIGGPQGIGKATLAYRMAKFVLANPNAASRDVTAAKSLAVDLNNPAARQVASGSHGGLLTLERIFNDKGTLAANISVNQAREALPFFGSTAALDGWRVCIVDTVEDLNVSAANALLKVIEEPPAHALFFLISHMPNRVLATIQSRCRKLPLKPLSERDVALAAANALNLQPEDSAIPDAAKFADGSVLRALTLLEGDALGLHQRTLDLLNALPRVDARALHSLGDALPLNDRVSLRAFVETIDRWLGAHLRKPDAGVDLARLARLAEVWEKINSAARDVESFNLERKPLVFSAFDMLAEASR
ncbi:MAG: DNA polymerase III subunit delta' [Afipia sp.]|nr:DNA polymerase III subunit delta' [Afipia sp.]